MGVARKKKREDRHSWRSPPFEGELHLDARSARATDISLDDARWSDRPADTESRSIRGHCSRDSKVKDMRPLNELEDLQIQRVRKADSATGNQIAKSRSSCVRVSADRKRALIRRLWIAVNYWPHLSSTATFARCRFASFDSEDLLAKRLRLPLNTTHFMLCQSSCFVARCQPPFLDLARLSH